MPIGRVILKYPLDIVGITEIEMSCASRVVDFRFQGDKPWIWVLLHPDAEHITRKFRIVGTGQPIGSPGDEIYLKTLHEGRFVWHLVEVWPPGDVEPIIREVKRALSEQAGA